MNENLIVAAMPIGLKGYVPADLVGSVGRAERVERVGAVSPSKPVGIMPEALEYGVILEFTPRNTPKSGHYAADGRGIEDSRRIAAQKARMKEESEPCRECAERRYQDGSNDMGVSFQTPTNVAPEAAASLVRAHEQEHVSRSHAEGREKNMNVTTSVTVHTSICPECKKIYVSGGTTYTRMTPRAEAIDAYKRQMELSRSA